MPVASWNQRNEAFEVISPMIIVSFPSPYILKPFVLLMNVIDEVNR